MTSGFNSSGQERRGGDAAEASNKGNKKRIKAEPVKLFIGKGGMKIGKNIFAVINSLR